jgi:hypothetical protein
MVFIGIAALAILLQAFVMLAFFLTARKTSRSVELAIDDLRDALVPIAPLVRNARNTLDRISPQIEVAVNNIVAITEDLRVQSTDVHTSTADVLGKLRVQANRLDMMLTSVMDSVDKTTGFVRNAVSLPARQLGGILSALRAISDSLRGVEPSQPTLYNGKDSDMFL